jgi:predicted metal-binding membrane protein
MAIRGIEVLWRLLRHRRAVVMGALAAVIAGAWGYLWLGAGIGIEMTDMDGGRIMPMPPTWGPGYAALVSVMWWAMMVAMMLPTAAPTVLLVTALAWDRLANPNLVPATALLFASGYLLVWCGFSLIATLLQWDLDQAGLLSERMAFSDAILASTVLIAAGVYQWTPLKDACLRHCRSPTEFLTRHWQPGSLGAVWTGVRHGLFCLGCCWMLMALLFVGGLMSLAWVGVIALFVLVEKTIPGGDWMSRFGGVLLFIWGAIGLVRMI